MKITLEVSLSDRSFGETVRGQLIQAGVNGMNSGALTSFTIAASYGAPTYPAPESDHYRMTAQDIRAREVAAIRWAAGQVTALEVTHLATPGAILTAVHEALGEMANAVENGQVKIP